MSQSLLEHRADLLSSLVRLFHCDIQTIYDQFSTSGQYKNLSEKLYHIFETYLPILQYNGNIFQNMPISKLPKVRAIYVCNLFFSFIKFIRPLYNQIWFCFICFIECEQYIFGSDAYIAKLSANGWSVGRFNSLP